MVEQCQTTCQQKGGAIFCDGQFVNAGNAESCADELRAKLSIEIDIEATVDDVGDTIEEAASSAKAEADSACSVSSVGARSGSALAMLTPIAFFGLARWRRRNRQPRR
jgi:MYXO-CTERM domain-containing protein